MNTCVTNDPDHVVRIADKHPLTKPDLFDTVSGMLDEESTSNLHDALYPHRARRRGRTVQIDAHQEPCHTHDGCL